MSRIGKQPIKVPSGVTITLGPELLQVKGAKGTLSAPVPGGVTFKIEDGQLIAERESDQYSAVHGLARALANNAIQGVTEGFKRELDIVGVGYKVDIQAKRIVFALGYSHPIDFPLPDGIEAKAERLAAKQSIPQYQTTITLTGIDKQQLGQVAANIFRLRKPDAYKGKGVRYSDKTYKLKPGKTGK